MRSPFTAESAAPCIMEDARSLRDYRVMAVPAARPPLEEVHAILSDIERRIVRFDAAQTDTP